MIKCLINKIIVQAVKKRKSLSVIKRYLKIKYFINVSESLISKRINNMDNKEFTKYGMENDAYSECCDAPMNTDIQRCSACGESCLPAVDEV